MVPCRRGPQPIKASVGLVTADRYAMAVALVGIIVPKRTVLRASVIPKRDGARPPLEAHAELGRLDMSIEHLENGPALVSAKTNNSCREEAVDEKTFPERDRVGPEYRMLGAGVDLAAIISHVPSAIDMLAVVNGGHALEHASDRGGERLVSLIHVGKERIAAAVGRHSCQV